MNLCTLVTTSISEPCKTYFLFNQIPVTAKIIKMFGTYQFINPTYHVPHPTTTPGPSFIPIK